MQSSKTSPRFIISGGGTGGHIYPAIALADEIKMRLPKSEVLFVGAKGKMEMEKVPKAGYQIKGLWISGLDRGNLSSNLNFPLKLAKSLWEATGIIKEFKPDAAIGTGGFASGPVLWAAAQKKLPVLIQEQNSLPGITNKLLKNKAFAICTAYPDMDKYFDSEKLHLTGNPIRSEIFLNLPDAKTAKSNFQLNPEKPVILNIGGSLGAKSLNDAWIYGLESILAEDVQIIWQTGKLQYDNIKANPVTHHPNVHVTEFIYNMKDAFAAADVIVSRAGAMAISELTLVGKPCILVPFPFAAEDHQTVNAQQLAMRNAAIMIKDSQAGDELVKETLSLLKNEELSKQLSSNIQAMAKPDATSHIVDVLFQKLNLEV
ncbi:MAG: undecaprenyldiphospho-muramoylpentapeptide beta-N-acetylglucosaminyltransferase [Weeksellaceae bacterium]|nr:undecaprenyldiphospho-muramoylpentapeptide beta-N-acetylglucosaminyltransferase [Weeksellaceae bacterium]